MKEDIDILLSNYLLGETKLEATIAAEQWINASHENSRYFEELKYTWEQSRLNVSVVPDKSLAWQKIQGHIYKKSVRKNTYRWIAAAVLIGIACMSAILLLSPRSRQDENWVKQEGEGTAFLPDGSVVTLRASSSLFYPAVFTTSRRLVRLNGEGYFRVAHQENKPFVIEIGDLQLKVLGTEFYVRADDKQTDLAVKMGKVQLSRLKDSIVLREGDLITVRPNDTLMLAKILLNAKDEQLIARLKKSGNAIENNDVSARLMAKVSLDQLTRENVNGLEKSIRFKQLLEQLKKKASDKSVSADSIARQLVGADTSLLELPSVAGNLEKIQHNDIARRILEELVSQGIAVTISAIHSFSLTSYKLEVNEKSQSLTLQKKLSAQYLPRNDYGIFYGTAVMTTQDGFHIDALNR